MATVEQPKKVTGGAFGRFLAGNRAALSEECKGKPCVAVVKLASERYKALGEAELASYAEKYKQAAQQYEKDMAAFLAAGGEKKAAVKKGAAGDTKSKKEKDPDGPKKPVGGAYGIFSNEKREEFTKAVAALGEKGFGPVAKMTSEAFKTLGEAEKAVYQEKFVQKFAAYKEAVEAYKKEKAAEQPSEKPATPAKSPEKKRGRPTSSPTSDPVAKAAKRSGKAAKGAPAGPVFEASVVAAAEKEGLTSSLSNLAARPAILAKGLQPMVLLKALRENEGLVNKAQKALLGGA